MLEVPSGLMFGNYPVEGWLNFLLRLLPGVADEFDFVFFAETDDEVALDEFAASAGFFLAVDGDFFGLDQELGLAAGVYGSNKFEKLVKFNKIFCVLHGDLNQWDL
jgi:hypothetical protein